MKNYALQKKSIKNKIKNFNMYKLKYKYLIILLRENIFKYFYAQFLEDSFFLSNNKSIWILP